MRFLLGFLSRLVAIRDYVFWFFGFDLPTRSNDYVIFEMRAEIIELRSQIKTLEATRDALSSAQFEGYREAETRDLNHLIAQYAMFFTNSSFDKFQPEEFLFFRKISMQFLSCAYQLGERNGEHTKASAESTNP